MVAHPIFETGHPMAAGGPKGPLRRRGIDHEPSDISVPLQGFFVAHFLTVKDQARSREFYVDVLGGKIVKDENPCYINLENYSGGGPTPDKPDVWLAPPTT